MHTDDHYDAITDAIADWLNALYDVDQMPQPVALAELLQEAARRAVMHHGVERSVGNPDRLERGADPEADWSERRQREGRRPGETRDRPF